MHNIALLEHGLLAVLDGVTPHFTRAVVAPFTISPPETRVASPLIT